MRQKSAPCGDAATSTPAQRLVVETAVFSEPRSSRIRPKLLILLAVSVKLAKRTNVRVLNALGELRMDTAKPTCVLVPTAPPPTG